MNDGSTIPSAFVYKILRAEEALILKNFGRFAGSPDDKRDGYVHLSLAHQVARTLKRYFAGVDVVVLKLDANKLGDVRYEPSSRSALYPHLYGSAIIPAMILDKQPVRFDNKTGEHGYEQPAPETLTVSRDGPYGALLTGDIDTESNVQWMLKGTGNMAITVPGDPERAAKLEETRQWMRNARPAQSD